MITRVLIATVAALFVAPYSFGQMKYSRTRSQSPTPTPTPLAPPQQKTTLAPQPNERPIFIPSQKTGSMATQSPTPLARTMVPPPQVQGKPFPASQQRSMATAAQPKTTPFSARLQPRPTPALPLIPPKTATMPVRPMATPVPPPDVKAYLDKQLASSKDQKFHMTVNGKDLALTPFHVWSQKTTGPDSTSTCIDMKSDEGRVYDIDFLTTGAQVSSIRIHRVNGEAVR